jgi:hypothetical protein
VLAAIPTASPDASNADARVANVLAANDGAAPLSRTESEGARGTLTDEPQVAVRRTQALLGELAARWPHLGEASLKR